MRFFLWGTLGARSPPSGVLVIPVGLRTLDFIRFFSLVRPAGLWEIAPGGIRNAQVIGSNALGGSRFFGGFSRLRFLSHIRSRR